MENYFKGFSVEHIKRNKNIEDDELAKVASRKTTMPMDVFFQTIEGWSVKIIELELRMVKVIQGGDWWAPMMAYLHYYYESDNTTMLLRMQ
jgi:hypothetical protein